MLKQKNFEVYGSEVNSEMVGVSQHFFQSLDLSEEEVREGNDENLNFPDNFFDLLVSINTIHYSSGIGTDAALAEFARVPKPGGFAIIETPSEGHYIPRKCKRIKENEWIWQEGGFREGEVVGFFDSKEHLQARAKKFFANVDILSRCESFSLVDCGCAKIKWLRHHFLKKYM